MARDIQKQFQKVQAEYVKLRHEKPKQEMVYAIEGVERTSFEVHCHSYMLHGCSIYVNDANGENFRNGAKEQSSILKLS